MRLKRFFAVALCSAVTIVAQAAQPAKSVDFSHKDWDLVCDNTLTCRAAGYSPDETPGGTGSTVLLIREAGPSTPVTNRVMLADTEDAENQKQTVPVLLLNGKSQGNLQPAADGSWQMSAPQYTAFLNALRHDQSIGFRNSQRTFIFSGEGATAALLKMDDVQGRVGTSGALIKKGNLAESSVKAAIPAPQVEQAAVLDNDDRPMTKAEIARYKPVLMPLILALKQDGESVCSEEVVGSMGWWITRLDEQHTLVNTTCWQAAYNMGDVYYVVSQDAAPELVTYSGTGYEKGVVSSSSAGRGIADCVSSADWTWDGQHFVQTKVTNTGRCAYIRLGGTWDLPTLIRKVIPHAP